MKRIRLKQKQRAAIAWMLFLMLMPLFVVKATHFHDDTSCAAHHTERSDNRSADNCEICLFVLSDFTEAESFIFHHLQTFVPFIHLVTEEKGACVTILSPSLRAPPATV
ncbi:hypothetical protein ACTMKN_03910 [Bacteroides pyogenes]|uniref:hypothetical protein n=1 Tax=Bacteroides pyogenes TaxID=310300 RepID=UPI0011E3E1F3|nr:hypothetical protein [Bacteroides pyogenes]MCE9106040.1 hypothetical protein [Bacteroides pyogenes]TYK42380.1 hypothetical protein FNJ59_01050 [Bacteroides pyogenes]